VPPTASPLSSRRKVRRPGTTRRGPQKKERSVHRGPRAQHGSRTARRATARPPAVGPTPTTRPEAHPRRVGGR
jgi:hypothetical protein